MDTTSQVEDLSVLIGDAIPRAARSERGPINPRCLLAGTNKTYVAPPPPPQIEREAPPARQACECTPAPAAEPPPDYEMAYAHPPGIEPKLALVRNGRVIRRPHRLVRDVIYYQCTSCHLWQSELAFAEIGDAKSSCGRASHCNRCSNRIKQQQRVQRRRREAIAS